MATQDLSNVIAPPKAQPGFQQTFINSIADITIGGGSAGGGKTTALLLSPLYYLSKEANKRYPHWDLKKFGFAIFRQTYGEITMDGGLWDSSVDLYSPFNARPTESSLIWKFPTGGKVMFEHLQHERELPKYQGAQFNMVGFDEVTHFSKKSFFYMLSRNRSMSGIHPHLKATCNPDPESFVAELIAWWIDQNTGFPIPERDGVVRWFAVDQDRYVWGSSIREVIYQIPHIIKALPPGMSVTDIIKSITFISGNVYGNKILLERNPQYLANLLAQDEATKARLLDGNWKIRLDGMNIFSFTGLLNLFNAIIPEENTYYMAVDHARFGRDLCVIGTWKGWHCVRMDILTRSDTNDILRTIHAVRMMYRPLPISNIVVDQDGIGVADALGCDLFKGSSSAKKVYLDKIKVEPNYQNFKTQCYYHASEKCNAGMMAVTPNFYVDGVRSDYVYIKGERVEIKKLIMDDLRVIKREKADREGKKMITNKEQHKAALDGRSPDFGDMIMMRSYFDLAKQRAYLSS